MTMTATQFNRFPSSVKQHLDESDEPVLVTDRGKPSMVVMRYADYAGVSDKPPIVNVADWLRMDVDVDFEVPKIGIGLRPVDFEIPD